MRDEFKNIVWSNGHVRAERLRVWGPSVGLGENQMPVNGVKEYVGLQLVVVSIFDCFKVSWFL